MGGLQYVCVCEKVGLCNKWFKHISAESKDSMCRGIFAVGHTIFADFSSVCFVSAEDEDEYFTRGIVLRAFVCCCIIAR